MIHIQDPQPGWVEVVVGDGTPEKPGVPDNSLLVSVQNADTPRVARQAWAAAGRTGKLWTAFRPMNLITDGLSTDLEAMKRIWRWNILQFCNRDFWSQVQFMDAVLFHNEYGDQRHADSWDSGGRFEWEKFVFTQAAVEVWNNEFRGKEIQGSDGSIGTIPAHVKPCIWNGPVGNDIPKIVAELAILGNCYLGYHPYIRVQDRTLDWGNWRYHSGRWHYMEQRWGLRPIWMMTEGSLYLDTAKGWLHNEVVGGDEELLLLYLGAHFRQVVETPAARQGRYLGDALFTMGQDTTWEWYWLTSNVINKIARMTRPFYQIGVWTEEQRMNEQQRVESLRDLDEMQVRINAIRARLTALHTMRDLTNQAVINVFYRAFGAGAYIAKIAAALSPTQQNVLYSRRSDLYTGPAIEDMPLDLADQAKLIAALPVSVTQQITGAVTRLLGR